MTAPRMEDTHWRHLMRYLGRRDPHVTQAVDEGDRARASESALLARVERLEGQLMLTNAALKALVPLEAAMPEAFEQVHRAIAEARAALTETP